MSISMFLLALPASVEKKDNNNCWRGDSNSQAVRHTNLNRTCIPFHHPSKKKRKA